MKLCVFFGTFNPIHNAHLAIANFIRSYFNFDIILFVPAYKPPHKDIDDELAQHRLSMVKLAIEGEGSYGLSNIEYRNEKFSYTYLTILELLKGYNVEDKINFIIGSDAFKKIENWYEADKLKQLVKFIVFPREEDFKPDSIAYLKYSGYDFQIMNMPFINLSSKVIRSRIRKGKSVAGLLPTKVLDYINEHELYQECPETQQTQS